MLRYILRRLLITIPLLLGVAFLSFLLIHLAPGDYFDTLRANPLISPETIEKYRQQYHLDQPVLVQFLFWIGSVLQGDLGYSFIRKAPVITIISQHAVSTLILTSVAMIVTWLVAVPLGVFSAIRHDTMPDRVISLSALLGVSFPSFIIAVILLMAISRIPGMPIGGMTSLQYDALPWYGKVWDIAKHLFVPAVAITILSVASLLRMTRANMLEVLRRPFILAARAYGLPEANIRRQAFLNAVNPLITLLGYEFASLLSGSAIIEIICSWPGLGSVMLEAVMSQDLFLVMGGIMMGSVLLILGNLLADVLLFLVDPRIQRT